MVCPFRPVPTDSAAHSQIHNLHCAVTPLLHGGQVKPIAFVSQNCKTARSKGASVPSSQKHPPVKDIPIISTSCAVSHVSLRVQYAIFSGQVPPFPHPLSTLSVIKNDPLHGTLEQSGTGPHVTCALTSLVNKSNAKRAAANIAPPPLQVSCFY
jgi:hypothetical protein